MKCPFCDHVRSHRHEKRVKGVNGIDALAASKRSRIPSIRCIAVLKSSLSKLRPCYKLTVKAAVYEVSSSLRSVVFELPRLFRNIQNKGNATP